MVSAVPASRISAKRRTRPGAQSPSPRGSIRRFSATPRYDPSPHHRETAMPLFSRKPKAPPIPVVVPAKAGAAPPGSRESRIFEIGSDLLRRARTHKSGVLSSKFYSDALMEWSMKDHNFKVQMFRFVDAFPMLRTPEDIYDHLEDYLSQPGVTVPGVIAGALKAGKLAKSAAVGVISKQITGIAG